MCSICEGHSSYNCPCCGEGVMVECPDCGGTGEGDWMVFDINLRKEVSVTESVYRHAADSEDEAVEKGKKYCKVSCTCMTCQGEGYIPE